MRHIVNVLGGSADLVLLESFRLHMEISDVLSAVTNTTPVRL